MCWCKLILPDAWQRRGMATALPGGDRIMLVANQAFVLTVLSIGCPEHEKQERGCISPQSRSLWSTNMNQSLSIDACRGAYCSAMIYSGNADRLGGGCSKQVNYSGVTMSGILIGRLAGHGDAERVIYLGPTGVQPCRVMVQIALSEVVMHAKPSAAPSIWPNMAHLMDNSAWPPLHYRWTAKQVRFFCWDGFAIGIATFWCTPSHEPRI
ncbi:hypothetical protein F4823DRAFT_432318 [Ustulina deusta]|nr:hypothetical protein F4823DRAFT_432318 [Ustulina deusta]